MSLIRTGSEHYNWGVNLAEAARIWKGGCIIRAQLLEEIRKAYAGDAKLANLLLDEAFGKYLAQVQSNWRQVVSFAIESGIPVPALSASLAYFDSYRSEHLPQNLTQAQRDYFGAHTYERIDKPGQGAVHTEWQSMVKKVVKKA